MPLRIDQGRPWVRKLDGNLHHPSETPFQRAYPASLKDTDDAVKVSGTTAGAPREARACGSHWGISECAVTKGTMIETATPVHEDDGDQVALRLNKVLRWVIPECLTAEALRFFTQQNVPAFDPSKLPTHQEIYLYHVEAGMRIFELYSHMDLVNEAAVKTSLASKVRQLAPSLNVNPKNCDYSGPWACETLGGAGGQTIVGAMSTGTHGGDVLFGPISSMVVAVHLVDAEGNHHWIERTRLRPTMLPLALVDPQLLVQKFKEQYPPGERPIRDIQHHRDDNLVNAVTVACGRMGIIQSVVLRAVRQYALEEKISQSDWSSVKTWINFNSPIFSNRFVCVEINPNGQWAHPSQHTCYVKTRELRALDAADDPPDGPYGRKSRGINPGTQPNLTEATNILTNIACAHDDLLLREPLKKVIAHFETMRDAALITWGVCAVIIWAPLPDPIGKADALKTQAIATGVIIYTTLMIDVVYRILDHVLPPPPTSFSDGLSYAMNHLAFLSHLVSTGTHYLSLHLVSADIFFIVRMIVGCVFEDKAGTELKRPAISYAVMDTHNYINKGCNAPGDSIEVFFEATDPNIIHFIERLFFRVNQLEKGEITDDGHPAVFGGYIAVRFMAQAEAFIAMQRWPATCSLEVAGLSRVNGTQKFLEKVEEDAMAFGATLHWGQRNNWQMKDVEARYSPNPPWGPLYRWREALSFFTEHGRYDLFSTKYSKRNGLEITTPKIKALSCAPDLACVNGVTVIDWDAISNPPETVATLKLTYADGSRESFVLPGLIGGKPMPVRHGITMVELLLDRELNGEHYYDSRSTQYRGIADGDDLIFRFEAELYVQNGQEFWGVDQNLYSAFISNALLVSQIEVSFTGAQSWRVVPPGMPVIQIPVSPTTIPLPLPVFNKSWVYRANPPHVPGVPPQLSVRYKFVCPP